MFKALKLFGAGLLISFLGALPLGSLNITAFDISASQNVQNALLFSFAAIFVELTYVRLTLWGSQKINLEGKWTYIVLSFAIILLLYLGTSSLMSVTNYVDTGSTKGVLFPKITSPILLGLMLSALNPLQLPFWLTWNKVLESKGMLEHKTTSFITYMSGIGFGTFIGLLIFIFAGKLIVANYAEYAKITSFSIGLIYIGFSFYLMFILFKKRLKLKTQ
ncbi:LysE family transporter [Croceitalea rosinachiae]|uniref:LysE family transporter n=1 Tax=Croceitalea rosinachiae TaxID=3075596 RepID=A0ABU3A5J0_9FLAO|nr:LysE family transporter [Croceitalea sp. F388]MDT0605440.1 LysE family transporter [Croceitalea sp. F388]